MLLSHRGPIYRAVGGIMRRDLRAAFHRIDWVGDAPRVDADRPVVMLVNHHNFFDGYAGWLAARDVFGRRVLTWMQEWDRFPFFAVAGAFPFPADDAKARAATMRRTAARFADPGWALLYFPEGHLHPPEDGIAPFDDALLSRLDRLLPAKTWVPVACYAAWEDAARPVLRMAAGAPAHRILGDEHARLSALWHDLRTRSAPARTLLAGRPSPQDAWSFRFARPFFRRYL